MYHPLAPLGPPSASRLSPAFTDKSMRLRDGGHLLGAETQIPLDPKFLPLTTLFHSPQQLLGL